MNTRSDGCARFDVDILWADASLEALNVTYENVVLRVREDRGRDVDVVGFGPIGVEFVGLWDEVIVAGASLTQDHPFAQRCWNGVSERLGESPPLSGSAERNLRTRVTLEVIFIDGSRLLAAAARFEAHAIDPA